MNNYKLITTIAVLTAIVLGIIVFARPSDQRANQGISNNVSVENGKQTVRIGAKGGYAPRKTIANANMHTIIEVETEGTYDCSSALSIPDLNYEKVLPPSGITEIEVPPQAPGTKLAATCSMGMYGFDIRFQ